MQRAEDVDASSLGPAEPSGEAAALAQLLCYFPPHKLTPR